MSKPCNIRPDPDLPVVKAITAGWLQLFRKHSMTLRGAAKPEQTDAQIFSFGYSGKMMHCCYLRLSGSAAYKQLFAATDPEVNIAACEYSGMRAAHVGRLDNRGRMQQEIILPNIMRVPAKRIVREMPYFGPL
jgi:hypothetical protein